MTDTRKAVARAIYEAWCISGVPWDSPAVQGNAFREGKALAQADAAIEVIANTEPTEEEVRRAKFMFAKAYDEAKQHSESPHEWLDVAMRAALAAARKAHQP
jgi:hypothetical protein